MTGAGATRTGHRAILIGAPYPILPCRVWVWGALPSSTIDWETAEGSKIIIEERDPNEVHFISGIDNKDIIHNVRVSPKNTKAMNFAFDVTPNKYVSGLITEYGVIKANESEILNIKDRLK